MHVDITNTCLKFLWSAFRIQLCNSKAVIKSTLCPFCVTSFRATDRTSTEGTLSEPRIAHRQKAHYENIASSSARVENSFHKMPYLHDLRSEIASTEGMAILNGVELGCMIYSKLWDRYKGFFFILWLVCF